MAILIEIDENYSSILYLRFVSIGIKKIKNLEYLSLLKMLVILPLGSKIILEFKI